MLERPIVQPRSAATSSLLPPRWERILSPILLSIILLDCLLRFLPWHYKALDSKLDASWVRIIQEAFLHHRAFGREIVFTYGPWGFAVLPFYHPALFPLQIIIQGLLSLLLMICTWRIGRSVSPRPALSLTVAALLCFLVTACVASAYEAFYPLLIWHFAINQLDVGEPASSATEASGGTPTTTMRAAVWLRWWPGVQRQALVTAAAFLSLTKFSSAVLCLTVIPWIALRTAVKQRRFPWVLPAYLLQVLLFWWLAGQRIGDLLPYLRNSAEVSSGYIGMALAGPAWHISCFLVGAGLIVAALGWERWRAERWYAAATITALGMTFFVLTKAAFVRHDYSHFIIAAYSLPVICLTTCAILWRQPIGRVVKGLALASCIFALPLAWRGSFPQGAADSLLAPLRRLGQDYWAQLQSLGGLLSGAHPLRSQFEKAEAALRELCPVPKVDGTFDLYPSLQIVLFANSARYSPRPVIQSYDAYTPRLARLNAEHLRAESAPDHILFGMMPIDGRYPALEDGLSWPELWSRYEPDPSEYPVSALESVVLRRSKTPRPYRLIPIGESRTKFGGAVEVPGTEQGPVWAEITTPLTTAGKMAAIALKPPSILLDTGLANGSNKQFLLVPGMAQGGFLLSPAVASPSAFGWIAVTPWSEGAWQKVLAEWSVRSITLSSAGAWAYQEQADVRFYRLEFAAAPAPAYRFAQRHLGLLQLAADVSRPGHPARRWVPGLGTILITPGGSRLVLPLTGTNAYFSLSPGVRSLRVAYGGLATHAGDRNAGWVGFRIVARDPSWSERVLWDKALSPPPEGSKTVTREESVALDLTDAQTLAFETTQERIGQSFIPFWYGVSD
jgi:hypothetical protein